MKRSEAMKLREIIETGMQYLPDAIALETASLYPMWKTGLVYVTGFRVRYNDTLYRCLAEHTSQAGWTPDTAVTLFTRIDETHDGTKYDPIPYDGNMALENGKYYVQDGATYLCNRDTENPVYNALSELVGLYVEVV